MEQKRVSLEVAKAIKEAGYPQEQIYDYEAIVITDFDYVGKYLGLMEEVCYLCPTYLEVWLWLWREKKICLEIEKLYAHESYIQRGCVCGTEQCGEFYTPEVADPEEAIINAIKYLVDNNLIK